MLPWFVQYLVKLLLTKFALQSNRLFFCFFLAFPFVFVKGKGLLRTASASAAASLSCCLFLQETNAYSQMSSVQRGKNKKNWPCCFNTCRGDYIYKEQVNIIRENRAITRGYLTKTTVTTAHAVCRHRNRDSFGEGDTRMRVYIFSDQWIWSFIIYWVCP